MVVVLVVMVRSGGCVDGDGSIVGTGNNPSTAAVIQCRV